VHGRILADDWTIVKAIGHHDLTLAVGFLPVRQSTFYDLLVGRCMSGGGWQEGLGSCCVNLEEPCATGISRALPYK
jgi:hypothetical protein